MVPAHLCECALGMLQGGMRTADVAKAINCNVHTVRCLRQRYRKTGWTDDRPRSGRPRVTKPAQDRYIRTSHLRDRYRMATTTARVTPETNNPSISAQTVRNRLREAGLRACRPVVSPVRTRIHRQQISLWPLPHRGCTRQDRQKVLFTDESGFVSPEVMFGFAFIIEGMSVTLRPVLWKGIDLEVECPSRSGAVCHSIIGLSLLSLQAISTQAVDHTIYQESFRLYFSWLSIYHYKPMLALNELYKAISK